MPAAKRFRKHFTPQEKLALLRRHLIDKVPISTLCEETRLQPTVVYRWLKQFFENGALALDRANGAAPPAPDLTARRKIAELEDKLRRKEHVLAELMEEHVFRLNQDNSTRAQLRLP
jgi:transposase-like protein